MNSELDALCDARGVTIAATLVRKPADRDARGDDWKRSAYLFSVVLQYQGRSLVTEYWMGWGNETLPKVYADDIAKCPRSIHAEEVRRARTIPPKPSAADVLYSLISDASALDTGFEDWCSDLGYDTDSRKALALYEECQKAGKQVRTLLGPDFEAFRTAEH